MVLLGKEHTLNVFRGKHIEIRSGIPRGDSPGLVTQHRATWSRVTDLSALVPCDKAQSRGRAGGESGR